ncbi:MAG: kinase [Phenylobacterium sp.]|uniref:kinase n=1 Tax=Phenylobacterium sp. TaxID=1871053 RepID=UPI002734376C|nr:kinase [Phenylobacterium sp.]MDP1643071.1 kinase [Phenylobacterium sp.]MDP3117235.1 kinase [Phenylobacterium sp.]
MPGPPDWIDDFLSEESLPPDYRQTVQTVAEPLAQRLAALTAGRRGPAIAGVCGAQGSGKSTLCEALARLLRRRGLRVAILSLDDLYLSRRARAELADRIHPLFATRGPPGTHDVAQGLKLFEDLSGTREVALPRFDKALDEPAPQDRWPKIKAPVDLILFEGWCVGAIPEAETALSAAVNRLEVEEDPTGIWRTYANEVLAGPYQALFAQIDHLTLLRAPSFEVVADWRWAQEQKLRARLLAQGDDAGRTMDQAQVTAFIQHYERLTRHILATLPARADLVVELEIDRSMRLSGPRSQSR